VPRARIILAASQGLNNAQIARALHITVDTARQWRDRWLELQPIPLTELKIEERLHDLPRSGKPSAITADSCARSSGWPARKPEQSERPISQWSGREIADEIMKRGIVAQISRRGMRPTFKKKPTLSPSDSLLADARAGRTVRQKVEDIKPAVSAGIYAGGARRTHGINR